MICATKGRVSKVEEYADKKTNEIIRTAYVATGENMISVRLSDGQIIEEDDLVLVAGDMKVFERRFYINGGAIRRATADDLAFFKAASQGTLLPGTPSVANAEAVTAGKKG